MSYYDMQSDQNLLDDLFLGPVATNVITYYYYSCFFLTV